MKKFIIFLIFTFTLIMNMLLVLFWNPTKDNDNMESTAVFSNTISLCKVGDIRILEELDRNKLKEFNETLSSLSTFEIELIKEEIDTCNQDEIINAFKRLKRRLPESDYKRVEEIFDPFINIGEIEEILKNKYD